ncbi:MAG: sigma 54-interacting transcriptional regulator [Deltaproteobacteria bacterium]|nr:sigma 54-interacting transcriptional regulator [Deltaproteobacteria bacterium]
MSPLLIADIAVGSICIAVGLLHLSVFVRRRDLKPHLFFALMAISAGLSVLTDPWMITAETVPSFISALKFRISFEGILWVALIWFIDAYTQTARRSLVWVLTAAYALALFLNLFLPFGILFSQISHLHPVTLAWGEKIVSANGSLSIWRFLPDAAFVFLLFFAGESCYRLYREGHQRRALGLGISLFLILGVGYVDGILMDLGIVNPPSLIGITFLALVLVMGGQLTDEVVRASALTRKVAVERERMDIILSALNTGLALMDAELNVVWVNEGTRKAFPWDDPVGKKCYAFAEKLKEPCEGCGGLQAIADGEIHETERLNSTNNRWYHIASVPIKDHKGQVTNVLESSTDISDQKRTEEARDQAMRELETLKVRLEEENIYLKSEIEEDLGFSEIIGKSNALLYVLGRIKQVAETDAIVLVQGETGTGKELVSRAIHQTSLRSGKPFVKVNCAALPANLVESELFGHEKGAFTGATQMRKGRFEVADKGTLFLDEISELPRWDPGEAAARSPGGAV